MTVPLGLGSGPGQRVATQQEAHELNLEHFGICPDCGADTSADIAQPCTGNGDVSGTQ